MARKAKIATRNNPQDKSGLHVRSPEIGKSEEIQGLPTINVGGVDWRGDHMLNDLISGRSVDEIYKQIKHYDVLKKQNEESIKFNSDLLQKNAALMEDIKTLQAKVKHESLHAEKLLDQVNDLKSRLSIHERWLRLFEDVSERMQ
jgi:hypothetical protein